MKGVKCLTDSVTSLSGVGAVRAAALEKLGIRTLRDLLYAFPRGYENRANIRTLAQGADGAKSAFLLTVGTAPRTVRLRGRLTLTKFRAFDETGTVEVVFYNQDYVRQIFTVGDTWRFWGTLNHSKTWTLSSPAYEKLELGKTLPDYISLYSLNSGITRKVMEGLVDSALSMDIQDFLPEEIRLRQGLPTLSYALRQVHHPESKEQLEKALRRLVFDELYCLSVGIAASRAQKTTPTTHAVPTPDLTPLLSLLPYELTGAQKRSIQEIFSDMAGKTGADGVPAMRRILIGDVGSGKTVCAMAALYAAAKAGGQAAIMAPTEILATQHYSEIAPLFSRLGIEVACLTGSTSQKEKNKIYARLSDPQNPLPVIIGTHALLGDKVHFCKLLLTITDEQHRFGILQREALASKATDGHLLVMTATPIPRTLALSLYGDLSISRLDEMPPGRQRVDTFVVSGSQRDRMNAFIRQEVANGGQVYIVCPAIEEAGEDGDVADVTLNSLSPRPSRPMQSALALAQHLRSNVFPDLTVGLLHGKMKSAEKEAVMNSFVGGDIDILVSTTVIEVGVNVPNASLMVVENAESFGLSQLHQLRGRVGRGSRKSYCFLVSDFQGDTARERLDTMCHSYDGYEIAEKDLLIRGPGDFFSGAQGSEMRQSGGLNLRLAKCCDDPALMRCAFEEASRTVSRDPCLTSEEHLPLREELSYYFSDTDNAVS